MKTYNILLIVFLLISCNKIQKKQAKNNDLTILEIKNCECIDKKDTDSIINVDFGFRGKLFFFYKEGIIRKIKAKTVKKLYYDLATNKDSLKAFLKSPRYYERFLCFNNKNQLVGKEGFLYDEKFVTVCFKSGDEFIKTSTGIKKSANSGTNWNYNYSLNLLESYIYLSKINYDNFPSSLEKYIPVFNEEGYELVIGHGKREIGREKPFIIYDEKTFLEVNKEIDITFTYSPKIIQKNKKNFLKISMIQGYNPETNSYLKKDRMIDLKNILTDPEFSY